MSELREFKHSFKMKVSESEILYEIHSLEELHRVLERCQSNAIRFHMEGRNDFVPWVRDIIGDEELAEKLSRVNYTNTEEVRYKLLEILRQKIYIQKIWFGLAIIFFVISLLVASYLIFDTLKLYDSPIRMMPDNNSLLFPTKLRVRENNIINFSLRDRITPNKDLKPLELSDTLVECKPTSGKYFLDGGKMICYIPFLNNINNTPYLAFPAESSSTDGIHYHESCRIFYSVVLFPSSNQMNHEFERRFYYDTAGVHSSTDTTNFEIPFHSSGMKHLEINFMWECIQGSESRNGSQKPEAIPQQPANIDYSQNLYVHSVEEIDKRNLTIISLTITAMFALFGIFTGIKNLRDLWRDN